MAGPAAERKVIRVLLLEDEEKVAPMVAAGQAGGSSIAANTQEAGAAAERKVIRVLLLEDEEIHRVLARALLKAAVGGVELDEAANGAEAVRRVREAGTGGYDLILTDRQMPLMDGHEAARQIRALLKAAVGGVELDEAANGAEAVRRVREAGTGGYDLILTDRQMPLMDGHEAARQIRALGVTTPIVGLSSDSLAADVDAFVKAGADDFTPKPLSKEKLSRILAKFNLA